MEEWQTEKYGGPLEEPAEQRLYKTDVIHRRSSTTFWGPSDPLLREFLRTEHYLEIEDLAPEEAGRDLRQLLNKKIGEMNRQTGHFTEIIVGGVLRSYDGHKVSGDIYFNHLGTVVLPLTEKIIRRGCAERRCTARNRCYWRISTLQRL